MSQSIQSNKNLTSLSDYSYALKNADVIEKAVAMAESGKQVAGFSHYLKAHQTLSERVAARNSKGPIDPKLHDAHKKLSAKLESLEKRIASISSAPIQTALGSATRQAGVYLHQAGAYAASHLSKWSWYDLAKYTVYGTAAVLAAPHIWEAIQKAPAPNMVWTTFKTVVESTGNNVNRFLDIGYQTTELLGRGINKGREGLQSLGYDDATPPNTENPASVGVDAMMQTLVAGTALTVANPVLGAVLPTSLSGLPSIVAGTVVVGNQFDDQFANKTLTAIQEGGKALNEITHEHPLETSLAVAAATWNREAIIDWLSEQVLSWQGLAGYGITGYFALQAVEQIYPGFTKEAIAEFKKMATLQPGGTVSDASLALQKYLQEKCPACTDPEKIKELAIQLAKNAIQDGKAFYEEHPRKVAIAANLGLEYCLSGDLAFNAIETLQNVPGNLWSLGKGATGVSLTLAAPIVTGCALDPTCRDWAAEIYNQGTVGKMLDNLPEVPEILKPVKSIASGSFKPVRYVANQLDTFAENHPNVTETLTQTVLNPFMVYRNVQFIVENLKPLIPFVNAAAETAKRRAMAAGINIPEGIAQELQHVIAGANENYGLGSPQVLDTVITHIKARAGLTDSLKDQLVEGAKNVLGENSKKSIAGMVADLSKKFGNEAYRQVIKADATVLAEYAALSAILYATTELATPYLFDQETIDKHPVETKGLVWGTQAAAAYYNRGAIRAGVDRTLAYSWQRIQDLSQTLVNNWPAIQAAATTYGPPTAALAAAEAYLFLTSDAVAKRVFNKEWIEQNPNLATGLVVAGENMAAAPVVGSAYYFRNGLMNTARTVGRVALNIPGAVWRHVPNQNRRNIAVESGIIASITAIAYTILALRSPL